ncbi:MAG: DUF1553 domain-containing protein, partial [Verrucomicrobiota bacterium]
RADELHDMVSTTGSAFLGLTIGCARCHNHKFDPIPQLDYYRLKACFAGVQHADRKLRTQETAAHEKEIEERRRQLRSIDSQLSDFEPFASSGQILVLDDEHKSAETNAASVVELLPRTVRGEYPAGRGRGERDDPGDLARAANFTPAYLAWEKAAGRDVCSYRPQLRGRFRVHLSWGCGWKTHAPDALYLLDRDGNVETRDDQTQIARVDQQKFADGTGEVPNRALWSGFYDAGVWDLLPESQIILRGGESDRFVAADVIVFEAADETASDIAGGPDSPRAELGSGGSGKTEMSRASIPPMRSAVHPRVNVEKFKPVLARRLRFTITRSTDAEPCIDELEVFTSGNPSRNAALASAGAKATASSVYPNSDLHKIEHVNDGRVGNSRSWISNERGRGWVELEFPESLMIERISWGRDREQKYADRLPLEYQIEVAVGDDDNSKAWRLIASSADRQVYVPGRAPQPPIDMARLSDGARKLVRRLLEERAEHEAQIKALSATRMVYAGNFAEMPEPTLRLHRGDPMQPREAVDPGGLEIVPVKFAFGAGLTVPTRPAAANKNEEAPRWTEDQKRRLALAEWIAHRENPLTARVMVNRIWQYHFGEGLVATPSDFGANGAAPTHPELLDWLAVEFIEQGWSIKQLHRLIVTSATYRQSSQTRADGLARDAGTRWLWRFPARRLEAEPIRDAILTVSGQLDRRMGGAGFSFFEANDNYVRVYSPRREWPQETWRRMVYGTVVRQRPDGVFGVFDCPDGGQIAPKRTRSTTPLQALNLLNSEFMMQQAELMAKRLERETGPNVSAQVRRAFGLCFQREPDRAELESAALLVKKEGLPIFCRAMFNANEFVFVD